MNYEEQKRYIKSTAFNAIVKMYHPLWQRDFTYYEGEGSFMEQRDQKVEWIVSQMNRDLIKLKETRNNEKAKI